MNKVQTSEKLQAIIAFTLVAALLTGCSGSTTEDLSSLDSGSTFIDDPTINNPINSNPDMFDVTDASVLAVAVNTPDVQGSTEYYPNSVSTALLSGPLVGFNDGSENIFSRSIPFNQFETEQPIRVQRVVASNYIDGRNELFIIIFTVKNISDSVVCGDNFNFSMLRADGSTGGISPKSESEADWHGTRADYVIENPVIKFTGVYTSCIEPNSSIYVTRGIAPSMAPEDLDRVEIRNAAFHDLKSTSSETITIGFGSSVVIPTAYTIGSLPESDERVRTGAADEFVKVTIVNRSPTVQDINLADMFLMDTEGYPVARMSSDSESFLSFLEDTPLEPGAEYELIFRNDMIAGDVSSIRVIVGANPIEPDGT